MRNVSYKRQRQIALAKQRAVERKELRKNWNREAMEILREAMRAPEKVQKAKRELSENPGEDENGAILSNVLPDQLLFNFL